MCEVLAFAQMTTPWDAQTKRIHDEAGLFPSLASSNEAGGQRVPYVASPSSAVDSRARIYRWPVGVRALTEREAASGLSSTVSCERCAPAMFSLRMSPDSYPAMAD